MAALEARELTGRTPETVLLRKVGKLIGPESPVAAGPLLERGHKSRLHLDQPRDVRHTAVLRVGQELRRPKPEGMLLGHHLGGVSDLNLLGLQHLLEARSLSPVGQQPVPKLTQQAVVEALVVDLQAQGVLPPKVVADPLLGLAVRKVLPPLENRHHGQKRRRGRRPTPVGTIHTGVVLIVDQRIDELAELMPEAIGRKEGLTDLVGIKKRGLFRASIEHNGLHAPSITQHYNKIFKGLQEK